MTPTVNIILPTIRFLPVTRDIIRHLVSAAEDATDVHVTIADGQEDDQKKEWIIRQTRNLASDGRFTYIGLKDVMQRTLRAVQLETEWILPLSDDDPYSVNFIRSMCSECRTASSDTMAIAPSAYLSYSPTQLHLFQLQNIEEQEQGARLLSLYQQAHLNGIVTWSVIRRKPFLEWLEFLLTKAIWPTYADQLLVSYLATKGKIVTSKEESFYAKDQRDWHDPARAIIKDSGSYEDKVLTLFHEILWISDLFTLLRSNGLEERALPSLTFRAAVLLKGGASVFEHRLRVLGIEKSGYSEKAYSLVAKLAAQAASLTKEPVDDHLRFFMQVQSVAAGCGLKTEASRGLSPHPRRQESELTVQQTEATSPVVSVVIPCYNQAQYLPEAVESVARQTFRHWECIIVDDGSLDDTSEVARRLMVQYPDKCIRLVEKVNGGLSDARNAGITASTCKYVLPLDADDRLAPTMLEKTVALLEGQPQTGVAFTYIQHFGDQTDIWRTGPFTLETELRDNRIPYCSLYRRDVFNTVGGYNTNLNAYEDWDFWLSALEGGWTGALIPEPLFLYRKRANSMLAEANTRREQLFVQIRANHPRLFSEQSVHPARVLITCTHFPPSVGGLETMAAQLGNSLIAKGYKVHVATERSKKREFKEYCGITIHSLDPVSVPGQKLPQAALQLRDLIVSGRYDACILLADPRNWIFWSLEGFEVPEHTRIIAQPLINAEGFTRWRDNRDFRIRLTLILKQVYSVVTISTGGAIVQYLTEEGIPFVYIPNAVEREEACDGFRTRYSIPESVPIFLHIANLWPVKNHLGLMDVLSTMEGDWRLVMIGHSSGDSKYDKQVREAVARDSRFMLIPGLPRNEIAAALKTADILLLASHGEVAPVTILEAMSHTKPWLATPQCGGAHDNAGGLIVPIEEFPSILPWLVKNPCMLQRLGQAGFSHWRECFSWDVVIHAWDSLIQAGTSSVSFGMPARIGEEMRSIRAEIQQSVHQGLMPASPVVQPAVWPEEVVAQVRLADEQFGHGNLAAARDAMGHALAILPDDPQLILTYGNVVLRLGDVEGARREFVKAATLHPNHGPAHLNLAAVLVMLERRDEAERSVKRALELNPNDSDAIKLFGRLCVESGRYEAGAKAYAVALGSNPSDIEALLMLGRCACETGDLETARLMYERVLQIEPGNTGAAERLVAVKGQATVAGSYSAKISEMKTPMVSVIVPTYNRPDTLLDALRSILNQTYRDFEIIVVNDGGSDIENIVRFLDKDGRITYIRHGSNRDRAAARNTGIRVASGKYIAYLDDDDLYYPDHLHTLVTFMQQSGQKVAYSDAYRAHQEKRDGRYIVTKRDMPYSFDFDHDRILVHNFIPVLCLMHEKECLDIVGLFDESLTTHEDWDLLIRLSRRFQLAHIKKVTYEFASRTDGSTTTSSKLPDFRRTYAIILERYKASAVEKPYIRAAQERLLQSMREKTASTDVATQPAWPAEVIEQVRQAEQHLVQGDPPAAAQALSQALQLVPHDPELIVAHGNVLLRLGDVEAARREFVKATVLSPEYAPAHSNLAAVLLHLGRAEEAEASVRQALALNPADTDSLKVLARVCLDGELFAEAVQVYVAVLRLHPDDVETLLVVGNCYAEAGRPEDATTFYQRVLQLDPGNTVAAENLAVVNSKAPAIDRGISTGLPVCFTQTGSEPLDDEPMQVSIIIPVFNRLDLTRQCLESIRRNTPVNRYEIIVVDNGSSDGTTDFLRQEQQAGHLRVVWNNENIGFAKACNQGARAAKSDYLLFLNNDTVSQAGWLEPLCEVLDRDHSVAAVGSKLLFPDGALQHAGVIVVLDERHPSSIMVPNHIDYKQPDHPEANRMRTFQSLTAACLLVRRTVFEQAGSFDEGYWNGYEDVDLCFTLQAQGWKLVYRPESVLIHHESQGGPERFVKEGENLIRLNQRWLAKCEPDFIIKSDGSIIQTDAGRIQMYRLPTEASPNCLPSPIDGQTDTNLSEGADQKEETARPVASIIIVTYNSASTIHDCLKSVFSCASARIEVIVVDNASTDDTRAILAEHKERITILEHSDNLGFSLACNQGIRASSGEYVVLLNPDTVVTHGWLERMKAHFGQDVGAAGPVSDFAAGLQNIDRHLPDGAPRRMGLFEVADLLARVNHGKGLEARLLTGFCMMIPRKVLDEIGLLDETLFLGNDDLDLSWRLREKGYRLVVATDTFVHHKGQVSFKSASSEQTSRLVQESTDRLYAKLEAHYGNGSVPLPMELWGIDWFRPSHAHFRSQASSPVQGLTSIIILAFNGLEHTIDCLKSINAYTPETHEIIVVDNGSTDGTVDYLRRYSAKHENIRVIANSSNKGFAAGNNQGLSIARGEHLLLLNNDTMVTSGWLKGILKLFKQYPDVGIVGPMSNYALEPQLVPGAKYQSIPQMEAFAAKWSADHAGQSLPIKRVVGFCLMTTRRVIDLIGGLDEQFGSGNFEDDDLCCRAALAGFQARIAQDVFIHHTGGQTFKIAGIDYSQSLDRNWELFKAKWGIPADAPYEKGYRFPTQTVQGPDLSIPLPDVGADHRCEDQGRWWQEISERPGRSHPAVTEEMPLSVVIVPNGHGLAPLWPSLVQHTKHPLAITILPSNGNGNGDDLAHGAACPGGWQIGTSNLPTVRLLNQLLESAHDDPVILLSSDLILTPGWLKRLLAAFDRDRYIAVVGPTLNQGPATQRVKADYKGTGKALRQFGLRRAHRYGGELAEVDSLAPFCIVFKGSACRAIGPLREDLDLSASLHDYFVRLRQTGRTVAVALDAYMHCEQFAQALEREVLS